MTDSGPNSARRRLTNAMHAMHCDQQIIVNDRLAHELSEAWDVYDASLTASLRAELADLREERDELLDTDAFHARHCLVEQDNDRLRAEKVDLEYRLGLQVRDAIALQREVSALRARLVQTEAALRNVIFDLHNCKFGGDLPRCEHITNALKVARAAKPYPLPEAPPSEKPHINPDCGRCQIAGCTEHAVQCIATDRHTRDRHLRGKPYGTTEAPPVAARRHSHLGIGSCSNNGCSDPPVAAGPEWPGVQNMDPSESLL